MTEVQKKALRTPKEKSVSFRKIGNTIPTTTYGTFALYRYPAKFIPQVISYAIKTYVPKGKSVFDPFAGYGTVGTVAKIFGNDYELWDLNPMLKMFHSVATMKPTRLDSENVIKNIKKCKKLFSPDWENIEYWYPNKVIPALSKCWGYYHSLNEGIEKKLLLFPLLKTTRRFSYNDQQRQKLSRSPRSIKKADILASGDWQETLYRMINKGIEDVQQKIADYWLLSPRSVNSYIEAGVDTFSKELQREHDVVITSPPYLQAQEYIRSLKMDLFWVGHSADSIRLLGKKEMPYRNVPQKDIYSSLYHEHLEKIEEPHLRITYERYFHGILGAFEKIQESIRERLLLFVGSANMRGRPIPLDKIFIDHLRNFGWEHEITLIDTIEARQMFFYKTNPATGIKDNRMSKEQLVVLKRIK